MRRVERNEVIALLMSIGRGEVTVFRCFEQTWDDAYCGSLRFTVANWIVTVFNDCGEWDYVESVMAPDGRVANMDEWIGQHPGEVIEYEDSKLHFKMCCAFENAALGTGTMKHLNFLSDS